MPIFYKTPQSQSTPTNPEPVKYRHIRFAKCPERDRHLDQAREFLSAVKGIHAVYLQKNGKLSIQYSLYELNLKTIESAFIDLGYKLDNRLFTRITRAINHYCEQTEMENQKIIPRTNQVTFSIYASRFKQTSHACRDSKPVKWRRYL